MTTVAIFGAAGKMGTRVRLKLEGSPDLHILYADSRKDGEARLKAHGLAPTPLDVALREAEIVVLALPDRLVGAVAHQIVPALRPGTLVVCLDVAAPYAGELPQRHDVSYFVAHPCHPPIANDEVAPEARADFFGGVARQSIVCALMQGPEEDYARGEALARRMFAPVLQAHQVTLEQIALMEPIMAETVALTCVGVMREGMDEAIRRGVPAEAARDFMVGHLNLEIALFFNFVEGTVSDGAKLVMANARKRLFQPDWKRVFEPENVLAEVRSITQGIHT